MSTTPVITSTTSFWSTLKSWLPVVELAGNVALLATGIGAGVEPLVASLENAVNPLLQSIGTAQPFTSTLLTVYATIIGVLTALKGTPGLSAAVLTQIDEYLTAAQAGTAAYVSAESGYNPANYAPVTPIP